MTEAVAPAVEDKAVRETQKNTKKSKNTDVEPTEAVEVRTAPLSAYQRMIVAQRVIDGMPFAKTQKNSEYQSVPIDAMRAAVRRACIEAGLVHRLESIEYTVGSNGKGTTMMWTGRAKLLFVNVDDPTDFVAYECLGCAMDNGDKGISKFETNLLKNGYKEVFDLGERGKDDIDAYANVEIEEEAERIEAIRERRARRQDAVKEDPFFGKPAKQQPDDEVVRLRKQVGAFSMMGQPYEDIIKRHKAARPFPEWDLAMLRSVLAECEAAKEGGQ